MHVFLTDRRVWAHVIRSPPTNDHGCLLVTWLCLHIKYIPNQCDMAFAFWDPSAHWQSYGVRGSKATVPRNLRQSARGIAVPSSCPTIVKRQPVYPLWAPLGASHHTQLGPLSHFGDRERYRSRNSERGVSSGYERRIVPIHIRSQHELPSVH